MPKLVGHRMRSVSSRVSVLAATAAVAGAMTVVACIDDKGPALGFTDEKLNGEQCSYFAAGDQVTICHSTSSTKKPYTIIRTNIASCGGHSNHAGDYVAWNDPTCSGQGCFPAGAPFDGSVECCDGLAPVEGCCRDIDECADGFANCSPDATCTNTPGGFTCACNPGFSGDGVTCANVDDCAVSPPPCQNGGVCHDEVDGYSCACPSGFTSSRCETVACGHQPVGPCGTDLWGRAETT